MPAQYALVLGIVLYPLSALAQTGPAVATGTCSIANSGSDVENLTINCGIGREQGQKIIDLLNRALASKDAATINAKLDELLKMERERPGLQPNHFYADGVEYGSADSNRGPDIKSGTILFESFRASPGYEYKMLEYKYGNGVLRIVCPSVSTAQVSGSISGMAQETKLTASGLTCRIVP